MDRQCLDNRAFNGFDILLGFFVVVRFLCKCFVVRDLVGSNFQAESHVPACSINLVLTVLLCNFPLMAPIKWNVALAFFSFGKFQV